MITFHYIFHILSSIQNVFIWLISSSWFYFHTLILMKSRSALFTMFLWNFSIKFFHRYGFGRSIFLEKIFWFRQLLFYLSSNLLKLISVFNQKNSLHFNQILSNHCFFNYSRTFQFSIKIFFVHTSIKYL